MAINKYNKSNLAVSSRNGHSIGVPHNTRVRRVQMVVQHHLGMGSRMNKAVKIQREI